ncbi:MAG: prepilin-type N-terminal cleavage/methylation domain-containing protein [Planctomycetota bacterium]
MFPIGSTSRSAFTLLELLVVIAIVTLLVGLLLPVLGRARGSAQAVRCGSNLRQLATANTAYAVDHDGRLAPGAADFLANLDRWHGARDFVFQVFDPTRGPLWSYFGVDPLKSCPNFVQGVDFEPGFESGNGGYGYNRAYVGTDTLDPTLALTSRLGARLVEFPQPAQTVTFTDAAFAQPGPLRLIEYSFAEPPLFPDGTSADPSIHFRHDERANAAWLDGHVSAEPLDSSRPNVYGVSQTQNRRLGLGWFGPDDAELFDRE